MKTCTWCFEQVQDDEQLNFHEAIHMIRELDSLSENVIIIVFTIFVYQVRICMHIYCRQTVCFLFKTKLHYNVYIFHNN